MPNGVGFTGSRRGIISAAQDKALRMSIRNCLYDYGNEFHHGDCLGGDAQAHKMAYELMARIIIHPPDNYKDRAWCKDFWESLPELPYLERNRNIVNATSVLIGLPSTRSEELRSGTWSTIRYARKLNRTIHIVYPDGKVEIE